MAHKRSRTYTCLMQRAYRTNQKPLVTLYPAPPQGSIPPWARIGNQTIPDNLTRRPLDGARCYSSAQAGTRTRTGTELIAVFFAFSEAPSAARRPGGEVHAQSEATETPFASSAATSVQLTLVAWRPATTPRPPATRTSRAATSPN